MIAVCRLDWCSKGVLTLIAARGKGSGEIFKDDLAGQVLSTDFAKLARQKELDDVESKDVWELAPVSRARAEFG